MGKSIRSAPPMTDNQPICPEMTVLFAKLLKYYNITGCSVTIYTIFQLHFCYLSTLFPPGTPEYPVSRQKYE